MYRPFTSLVKFIPRWGFFLCFRSNGIVFYISFSDNSLLVYRNAIHFRMLILYPESLLNLLISSNSLFVESLDFSIYKIMSSENGQFYYFLSNLDTIFFILIF